MKETIASQPPIKNKLILHNDQRAQFISKRFIELCESIKITQSMSKAEYPYDNALEIERINLHYYHTDEQNRAVSDFAYMYHIHITIIRLDLR